MSRFIFLLAVFPLALQAFDPGCSFSNSQCVYNVKLGHEGVCDSVGSAPGGSQSCCDTVQGNVNNLQGIVEQLTNQMKEVQSELGLKQSASLLLNTTTNERDRLLQELQQKEMQLNASHSDLADLVKRSEETIRVLKQELANATRDLNHCKGVLGMKVHNNLPVTASGDFELNLCTFENNQMCGYTQDVDDSGQWVLGHASHSQYTGPREDHTYGSPKGSYMFLDPNQGSYTYAHNRSMRLSSPTLQPAHGYCVRFWFNMYGADARILNVFAKIGTGLGYPIWSSYGNQGQQWHLTEISLDSEYTSHPFNLVFEGWTDSYKYSSSFSSSYRFNRDNIAIDDIYVYNVTCSKIPTCPPGSIHEKGGNYSSCYTFHTTPLNWYDSASACASEGAFSHLVSVNSLAEQMFLVNTIKQDAGLSAAGSYGWFTSGNDERQEGHFDWTDTGTPYMSTYSDWHNGQPNNVGNDQDCLLLQYTDSNYEWGDIDCDEPHPYICEVDIPIV